MGRHDVSPSDPDGYGQQEGVDAQPAIFDAPRLVPVPTWLALAALAVLLGGRRASAY